MTEHNINFSKFLEPLTTAEKDTINRLSRISLSSYNETDLREEYLAPLLAILGYRRDSDYKVLREEQYQLSPFYSMLGHHRHKLDYSFIIWKQGFWLLEAKSPKFDSGVTPPELTVENIGQAFGYAIHPEVDAPYYAVSNGWYTKLFDRDSNSTEPIIAFMQAELPEKFEEFRRIVDSRQIIFHIKRRLLDRIQQVLSADVDINRASDFIRQVKRIEHKVRPQVLENFRRAMSLEKDKHQEVFLRYLRTAQPTEVIENLFNQALSVGKLQEISFEIVNRVEFSQSGYGAGEFLLSKIFLEDLRPVTHHYFYNSLYLLGAFAHKCNSTTTFVPNGLKIATQKKQCTIQELFSWWADILLHHFKGMEDLRMLWAIEALYGRLNKRFIIYHEAIRQGIRQSVSLKQYCMPEEMATWAVLCPAGEVIQIVQKTTMQQLGIFIEEHYDSSHRLWKTSLAQQSWKRLIELENRLEEVTPDYNELRKELGGEWSELTFIDNVNKGFDSLGAGVCSVLTSWPILLKSLPVSCVERLELLARLNTNYAKECLDILGCSSKQIEINEVEEELASIFDPLK